METAIDFKKIKEQLPHGAQTKIAKMANVALSTVHLVLNGKSDNEDVVNAVIDYLTELQVKKKSAQRKLSLLII
jgi:predicted transcriptional regulator